MKKILRNYILWTYGVFIVFLLLIGVTMMLLKAQFAAEILKVISAWTSTFVFIVMFKKIYKQDKLINFVKLQFSQRINLKNLIFMVFIQVAIFIVSLVFEGSSIDKPINELVFNSGSTLLLMFFVSLIRGPLGEELGWRGFVLNELQKKFNPLKSALIVGVLWGFWHAPLWLLSGYGGLQLLQYSLSFLLGIIAASVIITAFYNINRNLIIPIVFHQLFNFFMTIRTNDTIDILTVTALLYLTAAVILTFVNYKKCLY